MEKSKNTRAAIRNLHNVVPPMPVGLVGAVIDGRPNFMTVGWMTRVNHQPPMLAVALNRAHHTPTGIRANGTFSVAFPTVEMEPLVDYCGVVSGRKVDKSGLFELFYGETGTAPLIAECPLNVECRLAQTVSLPTNDVFIGEIVGAWCDERFLNGDKPDLQKMDPLLLTMPDNRYWGLGEHRGRAWKDGIAFKKALARR